MTTVDPAERDLVRRAVDGDQRALTEVVERLRDPLYRLALRMTGRPADAEDAVQEILVRVLTRLSTWRAEAALTTWAYRVGANYLISLHRRSAQEEARLGLDDFGADLREGLAAADHRGPEATLLAEEVRLTCTQAMLQCLSREERVAFVLVDLFGLSAADAAWVLDITPEAFRKRGERARARLGAFLRSSCGVAERSAPCRCRRRIRRAVELGRIDPAAPVYARHSVTPGGRTVEEAAAQLGRLRDVAAVIAAHPDYAAPEDRVAAVTRVLRSGRFPLLD
ncbi:RNA polymerase sigma factor [Nocardia thailandica]|uniref:RNA polymerase sigma factor n=1 Tax=Nocardia thailandica TaxID=257275 RepID=UPI0002E1D6D7|nr:RNA polymerase sigma factor [Nocardia thailandica]